MIFVVHCNVITSCAQMGYNCSTCITSINGAELIRRKGIVKPLIERKNDFLSFDLDNGDFFGCGMSPAASRLHCGDFFDVNTGLLGLHESVDSVFYFNILPYVHLEKDWGLFNNSLPVPNVTEISS